MQKEYIEIDTLIKYEIEIRVGNHLMNWVCINWKLHLLIL